MTGKRFSRLPPTRSARSITCTACRPLGKQRRDAGCRAAGGGSSILRRSRLGRLVIECVLALARAVAFAPVAIVQDGDGPDHQPEDAEHRAEALGSLCGDCECGAYRLHVFLHCLEARPVRTFLRHGRTRAGAKAHAQPSRLGAATSEEELHACAFQSACPQHSWLKGSMTGSRADRRWRSDRSCNHFAAGDVTPVLFSVGSGLRCRAGGVPCVCAPLSQVFSSMTRCWPGAPSGQRAARSFARLRRLPRSPCDRRLIRPSSLSRLEKPHSERRRP